MAENKLTKKMVIDDIMAIIRPIQVKAPQDGRGAMLLRAMLARAKTPATPQGRQPARPTTPPTQPPTTQPPRTIG